MSRTRVAVVFGGRSTEHAISCVSAGSVLAALDRDISGIIEHDLYPCAPDLPLPIAKRTRTYLSSCSSADIDLGARA